MDSNTIDFLRNISDGRHNVTIMGPSMSGKSTILKYMKYINPKIKDFDLDYTSIWDEYRNLKDCTISLDNLESIPVGKGFREKEIKRLLENINTNNSKWLVTMSIYTTVGNTEYQLPTSKSSVYLSDIVIRCVKDGRKIKCKVTKNKNSNNIKDFEVNIDLRDFIRSEKIRKILNR